MTMNTRVNYVVVFVTDMSRSVQFYRDRVGLPVRFESAEWTEFDTAGATLALHLGNEACRPGFGVPDLDAFHARMVANGVVCVRSPELVFGAKVAQYRDTDGLVFSVGQNQ
jgi:catechol 2,3-dioxygenase-like lactoylglutathione lyase family enzyme